jgi:hypothetical protein
MKIRKLVLLPILVVFMLLFFHEATVSVEAFSNSPFVWTSVGGAGELHFFYHVAWGNNKFVILGDVILTSTDGLNWTQSQFNGDGSNLNDVVWGGNKFVAVGSGGTIFTSTDGSTWTPRVSGTDYGLSSVAWNGFKFVALGSNNSSSSIFTSPDGITWTQYSTNNRIAKIASNNDIFVAGGADGVILTSKDGISWTSRTSPTTRRILDLKWNSNIFVATDASTNIYTSSDGITWNIHSGYDIVNNAIGLDDYLISLAGNGVISSYYRNNPPLQSDSLTDKGLYDIASNGSKLVAVGWYNTIFVCDLKDIITPASSNISGAGSISVPSVGFVTSNYSAAVCNKYGDALSNQNVTWAVYDNKGSPVSDLVIGTDGVLKVYNSAQAGTYIIKAVSSTNSEVYSEKEITLKYTEANVYSSNYIVDNINFIISNVPYGTTFSDFNNNLTLSAGAGSKIYNGGSEVNSGNIITGMHLEVYSGDNTTNKYYTINVNKNSDTTINSSNYIIDNSGLKITEIPYGTFVNTFLSDIKPANGAVCKLYKADGITELTTGIIISEMKLKITAEDGVTTKAYNIFITEAANFATLNKTNEIIEVGKTVQLSTMIIIKGVLKNNTIWSSANSNIADVSKDGLVTGVKAGTTEILGTSADNTAYSASCTVTVVDKTVSLKDVSLKENLDYEANPLFGIAYGNGKYLAVGGNGIIKISTDGEKWIQSSSGTNNQLRAIVWGGDKFIAVGLNGTILTSPDGIIWTARVSGVTETLYSIAWNGSKFVVVGSAKGSPNTILTSNDGINWTHISSGKGFDLYCVIWGNGEFVAVGNSGTILTSPDSYNWTLQNGNSNTLWGIAWNGSKYVAVGVNGTIANSSNGINWTFNSFWNNKFYSGITSNNKTFVTTCIQGSNISVYSSPDGVEWTQTILDFPQDENLNSTINGIAWCENKFFSVGSKGVIISSMDGTIWRICNVGAAYSLWDIVWNGNLFAAVGEPGIILTSSDGKVWTKRNTGSNGRVLCIAWNGNTFVALTESEIFTSTDGINWARRTSSNPNSFYKLLWNGEEFAAVGQNISAISKDGVNWIYKALPIDWIPAKLIWDGSHYTAIGSLLSSLGLVTLTSYDGLNWLYQIYSTNGGIFGAAFNGSKYIAVGGSSYLDYETDTSIENSIVMSSSDGTNWRRITTPEVGSLQSITWDGNEFIATGRGILLISEDGETWQVKGGKGTNCISGITWNGSCYVAVDTSGDVIYSASVVQLIGDLNGDNKITNEDAVIMKNYLLGIGTSNISSNWDIDGDGKITSKDYALLRRF